MCDALKELFADEFIEHEEAGEEKGIELTKKIFKLSSAGMSVKAIADECQVTEEKVLKILE